MPRFARFLLAHAVLLAPEGDAGGGAGGAPPPPKDEKKDPPPSAPPGPDATKLAADLAATQAALKALQEKAKADEAARKDAEQKQLAEQGNFKTLAEQRAADLEATKKRLADLEADAAIGKSYREREQKAIDEAGAKLPEGDKAILDALPSIEAKQAFLKRISGAGAPPANAPPGANTPPPGSNAAVDVVALIATKGMSYVEKNHPKELDAYLASVTPKKTTKRSLF